MSTTIDSRVVEMRFDNSHFEKNVSTTMSTLDKLKDKLNLSGATKGIENVQKAADKFNVDGMVRSLEPIEVKFSALNVAIMSYIDRWVNKAADAGGRLAKSLSVDQITAGWSKYEQKNSSVQTLMNSTGKTIDEINKYLDKLMWFSDETSYSFTDMTSGLATMVSSGGDIEKLIPLITGVANATAFAGKGAAEFSRVLQYGVNQAYSLGYMQVQDWKSIEGATVNSKQLMESLISAGEELGKIDKGSITIQNFRNSLKDAWLDTEVMEAGFGKFSEFSEAVHRMVASGEVETTAEAIEKLSGKYGELGEKAFKAGQEYKSFSDAISATKDAVSSGWLKTFEIIFGNYEQAKELWTEVGTALWETFASGAEKRNAILTRAMGSRWDLLGEKIEDAGISMDVFQNGLKKTVSKSGKNLDELIGKYEDLEGVFASGEVTGDDVIATLQEIDAEASKNVGTTKDLTKILERFQNVVDEVWFGKYGNVDTGRVERLTEAGYDFAEVQELVNMTVDDHRLTLEDLTDEQKKAIGYTDEQIAAIKELAEQAEKTNTPLRELIDNLSKPSGRELLIDTFRNFYEAIKKPIDVMKKAWENVFPSGNEDSAIYRVIEKIHEFSEALIMDENAAASFEKICTGIFSLFDLGKAKIDALLKSFQPSITMMNNVLKLFGTDLAKISGVLFDYLTQFVNWLKTQTLFINSAGKVANVLATIIEGIYKCVKAFLGLQVVQDAAKRVMDTLIGALNKFGLAIEDLSLDGFIAKIESFFGNIESWIKGMELSETVQTFVSFGEDIVKGLIVGITDAASAVVKVIIDLANSIIETFAGETGIESPSKVFAAFGMYLMLGLLKGLTGSQNTVINSVGNMAGKIIETVNAFFQNGFSTIYGGVDTILSSITGLFTKYNIDGGSLIVIASLMGIGLTIKKIVKIIETLTKPVIKFGEVMDSFKKIPDSIAGMFKKVGNMFDEMGKYWKGKTLEIKAKALLTLAIAISLLVAAVAALSYIPDHDKLWSSVGIIAALVAVMSVLVFATSKLKGSTPDILKMLVVITAISGALGLLAHSLKTVAEVDETDLSRSLGVLAGLVAGVFVMALIMGKVAKGDISANIAKAGVMFIGLAIAVGILVYAMKTLAKIPEEDIDKGIKFILWVMAGFAAVAMTSSLFEGQLNDAGKMFIKIGIAIGIIALALKTIASIEEADINKSLKILAGVGLLFVAILAFSALPWGTLMWDAGGSLMKAALGILVIAGALKIIATMTEADIEKSQNVVECIAAVFKSLLVAFALMNGAKANPGEAGSMILKMAAGMVFLAVAMKIIATMNVGDIIKGGVAVTALAAFMAYLVKFSEKAGQWSSQAGTMLLKMSLAILILVGAIALIGLMDPADVAVGVAALGVLMTFFAGLIAVTKNSQDAVNNITKLMIAVGVLAAAVIILSTLDSKKVAIASASLAVAMGAFSLMLGSLKHLQANVNLGSMAGQLILLTVVIAAIGGILYLMGDMPVESTLAKAGALSTMLLALAATTKILSTVVAINPSSLLAMAGLVVLTDIIGKIIGSLEKNNLTASMSTVLSLSTMLIALSAVCVILSWAGKFAATASAGCLAFAEVIGTIAILAVAIGGLVELLPLLETFLATGLDILTQIGTGIGEFIGGIAKGFISKSSEGLVDVGTNLSKFATEASDFFEIVSKVDGDVLSGVANLCGAFALLTGANFVDWFLSPILGDSQLEQFAKKLPALGMGIKDFSDRITADGGIDVDAITNASTALEALFKMTQAIPNSGGLVTLFTGDNDMSAFGPKLVTFGDYLKQYGDVVKDVNVDAITNSTPAAQAMVDVANTIPNSDGLASLFSGDNDIKDFGRKMRDFGSNLVSYGVAVSTLKVNEIEKSKSIIINSIIPIMNGINDTKVDNVDKFVEAINNLSKANIAGLTENLGATPSELAIAGANVVSGLVAGLESNSANLKSTGNDIVAKLIAGITEKYDAFILTGKNLLEELIRGLENNISTAVSAVQELVVDTSDAITKYRYKYRNAGKDLVEGFANGIDDNTYLAEAKAKVMARAAIDAAKKELDSHSPSREFYNLGVYSGQGFVNAFADYESVAGKAGGTMARSAIDGLKQAISNISNIIDSDMDVQPTIRPVIDLSDVTAGVNSINGLFSNRNTLSVDTRMVGGLASSMQRIQNGGNSNEIVSAIKGLRGDIANMSRDSYTINGVTYDDGSNVSNAVKSLIRAANIERRK